VEIFWRRKRRADKQLIIRHLKSGLRGSNPLSADLLIGDGARLLATRV
jgi:hypothetical protein